MRICIMYDSLSGNGKKLAESIAADIPDGNEIFLGDVKEVKPSEVVEFAPDAIIVGGALRKFNSSPASKKWLKQLDTELRNAELTIKYGSSFLTHALPTKIVKGWGKRFLKKLNQSSKIINIYPECLTCRVQSIEGPFIDGEIEKGIQHTQSFMTWAQR